MVRSVLDDPPQVHVGDPVYGLQPEAGVWRTEPDCYDLLADLVEPGMRTLETGLGLSTVLFALWRCQHTCVVAYDVEVPKLRRYLQERGIADNLLEIVVGRSDRVLPALEPSPLDVVLVDGGHGFPTAILDWYYAGGRLRDGGLLVIDDLSLRSVRAGLLDFLDADDRWEPVRTTGQWGAWRRRSSGSLSEGWTKQPFFSPPRG